MAKRSLQQTTEVTFLAHVLRENLGEVLKEEAVFPVAGGQCLPLKDCLLWDAEMDFKFLKRQGLIQSAIGC